MDGRIPVESLVMGHAIKYNRLSQLVQTTYAGSSYSDSTEISILIDLNSILKGILRFDSTRLDIEDGALAAGLLNLCAHYRAFFKNIGVNTNIYIIRSTRLDTLNKDALVVSRIATAMNIVNMICPYLNNITLYDTYEEYGVGALDIANYYGFKPAILLTKDIVNYQLNSDPRFAIFRPVKKDGVDSSESIFGQNTLIFYYARMSIRKNLKPLNLEILSYQMALTRVPERGLNSILAIPSANKALFEAISNYDIIDGRNHDIIRSTELLNKYLKNPVDPMVIDQRYQMIDIKSQYERFASKGMIFKGRETLMDQKGLEEINYTYFRTHPIDFMTLTS